MPRAGAASRWGPLMTRKARKVTVAKAVRRKCLECCGGSAKAVAECPSGNCPLFQFRAGRDPNRPPRTEKQEASALQNFCPKASRAGDD